MFVFDAARASSKLWQKASVERLSLKYHQVENYGRKSIGKGFPIGASN